jgi:hypothetical protein
MIAGHLAQGAAWVVLAVLAARGSTAVDLPMLGWLHLVALGWLTTIALSVLFHVIPQFTDVAWRGESIARGALIVYIGGVVAFVTALLSGAVTFLPWAGAVVVMGLLAYLVPAIITLAGAFANERVERAIARALLLTMGALLCAAALGAVLASALAGFAPPALLATLLPIHATFGLLGWLTVLVIGVSARTIQPIAGLRSPRSWAHIVAGTAQLAGICALVAGFALALPALTWLGAAIASAGLVVYAADIAAILARATVPHRPPQAFIAAAILWLVVGVVLSLATLAGASLGTAAVYLLLVGWIGQMIEAHVHHIGVRLIATMARGDDDETRPEALLASPLSWFAWVAFQCAVAVGAFAFARENAPLLVAAALCGIAGWIAMSANLALARRRAALPVMG